MKTSHAALGILGGVVVGTVLGVLFAPEKGATTRKKIATKGNDLKDNLKNSLEDLANKAYGKVNNLASKANEIVDETLEEGEHTLNNIRDINKSIL